MIIKTFTSEITRDGDSVIKTIPLTSDSLRELSILRVLDDPRIISLKDFEITDTVKLRMPLAKPVPKDLPIEDFYSQCLEILCVLESYRLAHLDFREENLGFLNGKIILLDLGRSFFYGENDLISMDLYPPSYIRSPKVQGSYWPLDSQFDVWAFGKMVLRRWFGVDSWSLLRTRKGLMADDLKRIENDQPLASELASNWNINITTKPLNLPFRPMVNIPFSDIMIDDPSLNLDIAILLKDHIKGALSIYPNINSVLSLYSSNEELTEKGLTIFKKLGYQIYSK